MKTFCFALLLGLTACSGPDASDKGKPPEDATKVENPFRGVMQDRTSRSPDEALFVEKCSMCHRQMGMGTVILARRMAPERAMLEARGDLTIEQVSVAVRQGIGNMPRVSRGEVSDAQLNRIARYLSKGEQ